MHACLLVCSLLQQMLTTALLCVLPSVGKIYLYDTGSTPSLNETILVSCIIACRGVVPGSGIHRRHKRLPLTLASDRGCTNKRISGKSKLQDHIESQLVEYIWWGSADFGNTTARCTLWFCVCSQTYNAPVEVHVP
jgi:hypothetical protein